MKSPEKVCGLDPMLTPLIKQCLLEPVAVITKIISFSLLIGIALYVEHFTIV